MMLTRILLALLLFTSVAVADDDVQAIAPRGSSCIPNGVRWLEIQQLDTAQDAVQTTVVLFGNGATKITRSRGAGEAFERGRCLREEEMKKVETLLKGAPWQSSPITRKVACKTTSTRSTVIKVFDKAVFTERECAPDALDAKSRANLAKLKRMLPTGALPKNCAENPLAKGCV
jgi:hypothetical protein